MQCTDKNYDQRESSQPILSPLHIIRKGWKNICVPLSLLDKGRGLFSTVFYEIWSVWTQWALFILGLFTRWRRKQWASAWHKTKTRICPLVAERTWFAGAESLERNITESGLECRRNSGGNPQWHEGWNRGGLIVDIDPEFMACYIAFIVVRIPRHNAMYEPISQVFD